MAPGFVGSGVEGYIGRIWGYIGFYHIGIMENVMETTVVYTGYAVLSYTIIYC